MNDTQYLTTRVLRAVALGMSIPSMVLIILKTATIETIVTLLSIGFFSLALASLIQDG